MNLEQQVCSLDLAKRLTRHQIWYRNNKERAKANSRRWEAKNPDKNRLYKKRANLKLRQAALDRYGRMCACCGEANEWFLAIDHMDGNGREHRRQMGYSNVYGWLRKAGYPKGFQTLCHNCNCAKGFYGQCPHTLLSNKKYGTFKASVQSRTQQAA